MSFKEQLLVGLIVNLQEQFLLLTHCVDLIKNLLEEEDEDDIFLDNIMPVSREIWTFDRYGTYWEKDVPNNDAEFFKEAFRVERHLFPILVEKLSFRKKDTRFRRAIPLEKRIAIALYTLGSSSEYRTIGSLFGVSTNSVCKILHEFCKAIIENLSGEYLPPDFLTESNVEECVKGFEAIGFPQCLGAVEQQMFNYNLSKARRVVENAFGHLKARFRHIGKGLDNHPRYQSNIIMCCCILHNFLNFHNSAINETWKINQNECLPQPENSNMSGDWSTPAGNIRKAIAKFVSERQHF